MPTSMSLRDHLEAITLHSAALRTEAEDSSMADPVPSCPDWTVGRLLQHHGGVCRWATAIVAGGLSENPPETEVRSLTAGPGNRDALLTWHRAAVDAVVDTITHADDAELLTFLPDAPRGREFWARRVAHESVIHGVDAMAARLGHVPTASSTAVTQALAVDGIDELVMGLLPRRSSTLRADAPITMTIAPTDIDIAWTVRISDQSPVSATGIAADPDALLTGTAAALYLGLWNRGDEIAEQGRAPVLGLWHDKVRISWD